MVAPVATTDLSSKALPNGQRLGRYVLVERLAANAWRELWQAVVADEPGQAVLIYWSTVAAAPYQTANLAPPDLEHPAVVGVLECHPDSPRPWVVMAWPGGQNLADLLRQQGPLSVERTAELAGRLLVVLEYAHQAGQCHGDLQPQNLWIDAEGRLTVTGFGLGPWGELARSADQLAHSTGGGVALPDGLTVSPYLAPECDPTRVMAVRHARTAAQRAGPVVSDFADTPHASADPDTDESSDDDLPVASPHRGPDEASHAGHLADLYAVGAIMYEMLTGDPHRMRFPIPNVPDWLGAVIETATRPRPQQRYESAREMRTQLDGRLPGGSHRHRGGRGEGPPDGRRRRRRRRESGSPWPVPVPLLWACGIMAVLVVGVVAFAGRPPRSELTADYPADTQSPKSNSTKSQSSVDPARELLYDNMPLRHWVAEMETASSTERVAKAAEALRAFGRRGVVPLVRGLARHGKETESIVIALQEIGSEGLPEVETLKDDRDLKVRSVVPLARILMAGLPGAPDQVPLPNPSPAKRPNKLPAPFPDL